MDRTIQRLFEDLKDLHSNVKTIYQEFQGDTNPASEGLGTSLTMEKSDH